MDKEINNMLLDIKKRKIEISKARLEIEKNKAEITYLKELIQDKKFSNWEKRLDYSLGRTYKEKKRKVRKK